MVERSVKVRLMAEIGQYEANMRKAADAAKTTGKETAKAGEAVDQGARKMAGSATQAAAANDQVADSAERVGKNMRGAVGDVEKMGDGLDDTRQSTEQAAKSADDAVGTWGRMANTARDNEQAWSTASTALLGIGAAAVAGAGMAVKTFADFDKAMSSVQAATLASEGDMNKLREAAVKAGADTAFSAEEAAAGIEELAKAGVATEDVLGGGLDGALSLAAAGALEVGDAAEIAASALTQFKLEGSDVEHIADLLAAGAGKAQGSVEDLGAALNQSGLVAASTGLTIEETTGALASFASAGLVGSDAGTSFKTMLMALNPSSKEAGELMDELGLSAYDAQGNFVGMSEYAGILQGALRSMSDEQRNATLKTIFGSDAVRAANILYEQGAAGVQQWEDAVNDAGYAAETASLMQDNLAGDLEKLGGAIDTAFLKSGSGANDFLRGLTQGAESAVDAIGKIPSPVLTAGTAVAGIGGIAALAAGGIMKTVSAVSEARDALDKLAPAGSKAHGVIGKVGSVAGKAAVGLAALEVAMLAVGAATNSASAAGIEEMTNALSDLDGGVGRVNATFRDADFTNGRGRWDLHGTVSGIDDVGDAVSRLNNQSIGDGISEFFLGLAGQESALDMLDEQLRNLDSSLALLADSGDLAAASDAFREFAAQTVANGDTVQDAADKFPELEDAVYKYAESIGYTLKPGEELDVMLGKIPPAMEAAAAASTGAASGADAVTEGLAGVAAEGEAAELSLEDLIDALATLGMIELDAQAATGAFHEALRETVGATEDLAGSIMTATGAFNVTTEAGYAAQQAFASVATAGWDMVEANAAAGGTLETVTEDLWSTYNGLVTTAEQFGFTADEAAALAREAMGIPPEANIESWMSDAALRVAQATGAELDAIDGRETKSTHTHTTINHQKNVETWEGTSLAKRGLVDPNAGRVGGILPPRAAGGRVPALANGGRLPSTGLGTDQILGISSMTGTPTAWVDDREWVVNRKSSDKYDALLGAVNRDDPRVRHLAGFASGGRPASREFAAAPAGFAGRVSASVDVAGIEAAVERGTSRAVSQWRPAWQISDRQFDGVMQHYTRAKTRR